MDHFELRDQLPSGKVGQRILTSVKDTKLATLIAFGKLLALKGNSFLGERISPQPPAITFSEFHVIALVLYDNTVVLYRCPHDEDILFTAMSPAVVKSPKTKAAFNLYWAENALAVDIVQGSRCHTFYALIQKRNIKFLEIDVSPVIDHPNIDSTTLDELISTLPHTLKHSLGE